MVKAFYELDEEVKARLKTVRNNYGGIEAAFVTSEEELRMLEDYWKERKSRRGCGRIGYKIDIDNNNFRGADWYFLEGYDGDQFQDDYWYFKTLTEKKRDFQKWCKKFEEMEGKNACQ